MSLSIDFAKAPQVPARLPLLGVERAQWSADEVVELARRNGLSGEATDRGLWHIVDDGRAALEVFQASHSFRFSRRTEPNEVAGSSEKEIDQALARESADSWVQRFAPEGARPELTTITQQEVLVAEQGVKIPQRRFTAARVNYTFSLDDQALLGPGAKLQVAVDPSGQILEAYRFWRNVSRVDQLPTVSSDEALSRFSRSELFADLTDRTARASVSQIRLGHLCLPPSEPQEFLVPVFELRGVLSTELHPHYEFVQYVAATTFDEGTAKARRQAAKARPRLVTA
jgi:hypothetical protein